MASIKALVSRSAKLQQFAERSDEKYDGQIQELVASLRQSLSDQTLNFAANDPAALDSFDPAADAITYLFLLRLQIQTLQESSQQKIPTALLPSGTLWPKAVHYIKGFNPVQVRYVGNEWRQLIELVAHAAQSVSQPLLATKIIRDAMLRLDPSCSVFTSTHLLFVRLCLHAKSYGCALPVLDKYICHFPGFTERGLSKSSPVLCARHETSAAFITARSGLSAPLTWRDQSRYFLYGGMIYMALKEWNKASHFLELVMSMPSLGPISMIMVEAYKKWVLVGLIEAGKLRPTPKTIAPNVLKIYQSIARPYLNLAQAFELGDLKRLNAEVDAAVQIWRDDNNMGLVSQVKDSLPAHALAGIKKIFAAITVSELSGQALSLPDNVEAAESEIASLIMSGSVSATLVHSPDHPEATRLRFPSDSALSRSSHELQVQNKLENEGRILEALIEGVKKRNQVLGLGPEYIDHLRMAQNWGASGDGFAIMGEDTGLEMDEDIMGDQA